MAMREITAADRMELSRLVLERASEVYMVTFEGHGTATIEVRLPPSEAEALTVWFWERRNSVGEHQQPHDQYQQDQ